jgi:2-polyprenyl-3-methyl-5-hydroxy-6-metoxy-1,4-benzoquinol methylase
MRQSNATCWTFDAIPYSWYEVITALDVMEHLADPLPVAKNLVDVLQPGGYLHWNFVGNPRRNDLDLATEEQQEATVQYLYAMLALVYEGDGYRVSQKR